MNKLIDDHVEKKHVGGKVAREFSFEDFLKMGIQNVYRGRQLPVPRDIQS
jgi:hypothetical protein